MVLGMLLTSQETWMEHHGTSNRNKMDLGPLYSQSKIDFVTVRTAAVGYLSRPSNRNTMDLSIAYTLNSTRLCSKIYFVTIWSTAVIPAAYAQFCRTSPTVGEADDSGCTSWVSEPNAALSIDVLTEYLNGYIRNQSREAKEPYCCD